MLVNFRGGMGGGNQGGLCSNGAVCDFFKVQGLGVYGRDKVRLDSMGLEYRKH